MKAYIGSGSLDTTTTYDNRLGKPTKVTNPNGAKVNFAYDVFGRVVKVWKQTEDATEEGAATIVHQYDTTACPNRVATGIRKDMGGDGPSSRRYRYVFYDGLGREVQRQEDFESSTKHIFRDDVADLRVAVNAVNGSQTSTDNPLTTSTPIKAVHYDEVRVQWARPAH